MEYLFKRKGSDNWYVRLQPPGQKITEKSLGTSDLKLAEIAAMPIIRQHKTLMYQRRQARLPRITSQWWPTYAPGMHEGFFATERELRDLTTGAVIGPNGGPAEILTPAPLDGPSFEAYDAAKARSTLAVKNGDDDLLETYIKHNGIDGSPRAPSPRHLAHLQDRREGQAARQHARVTTAVPSWPTSKIRPVEKSRAQHYAAGWCR